MNWCKPREEIRIKRDDSHQSNIESTPYWRNLRRIVLDKLNYICRYCGATYQKYMIAISLTEDDSQRFSIGNMEICCRACYLITHINYGFNEEMILCRSQMSQLQIVKATIDSIILNKEIPKILEIDPNAEKSPISLLEFSYILSQYSLKEIPKEMKNLRIFFTSHFDITFVENNYFNSTLRNNRKFGYMFLDEEVDDKENDKENNENDDEILNSESSDIIPTKNIREDDSDTEDKDLADYKLSKNEENFLIQFFNENQNTDENTNIEYKSENSLKRFTLLFK